MTAAAFRKIVLGHFRKHGRHDLPWRTRHDPYAVLVSEIMLQQTQVPRVIPKFRAFLRAFPGVRALARAKTSMLLRAWQGLGYNRRALMLQRCAAAVVADHGGTLPRDFDHLVALPGIGPYTAGAVMAFAYDARHPVIETNIRRVYLHHFFPGERSVPDVAILKLVERDLRKVPSPRQWYAALMDYGTHLAATVPNPNRRARAYSRQSRFSGSTRQLRGAVLRLLVEHGAMAPARLTRLTADARTPAVLARLVDEGMVRRRGRVVVL
jgi:A/G-specific adenine glycosylase